MFQNSYAKTTVWTSLQLIHNFRIRSIHVFWEYMFLIDDFLCIWSDKSIFPPQSVIERAALLASPDRPLFMNNWWCVSILHPIVSIWLAWADRRLFGAVKYCVSLWDVEPVEAETVAQTDSYIVSLNGKTSEEKMQVDPDRMSWPPRERTIWHGIRSSIASHLSLSAFQPMGNEEEH